MARTKNLEGNSKQKVENYFNTSKIVNKDKFLWDHFEKEACKV